MAWKSITLTLLNSEDAEKIEQHLLDLDAVAVTYTDAGDEPILEPALNTTPLWSDTNLTALFDMDTSLEDIKISLFAIFGEGLYKISDEKIIEDKTWEREWLEHFKPMKFGQRLWVCPNDMQIPDDEQNDKNVIVDMDPGMAFGTGTHETTALCLEWLDDANVRKKSVLDYGAGSGILAIAALKLGAHHATCLDIDIQAIESCLANAERNNVLNKLKAYLPDDSDWSEDETFDIILANILATPLIAIVQDIRRRLRRGGQIVLSGILANQAEMVKSVYTPYFNMDEVVQEGDWVRLSGRLKTASEMLGEEECVTICPNCDESFFVTAEDLDLADGEVRCGECDTIFFAIDFIDPDPDGLNETSSTLVKDSAFDTKDVPKAHLITGMWMHNKGKLVPVEHTASAIQDAENQEQSASTDDAEASTTLGKPVDSGEIPTAHAITGLWPSINENDLPEAIKINLGEDIKPESQAAVDPEHSAEEAQPTNADTQTVSSDAEITIEAKDRPADHDSTETQTTSETNDKEIDPILFEAVPAAVELYDLEKTQPMLADELAALHAPKPSKKAFGWFLGSIFALLIFGAQYLHQHRNQLAIHPSFGEPIRNLYAKLPLDIEPDWVLDAYSINASSVALNPLNTKQLVASFNLSNTASHAQIFPIIRLSLFNRWGERIAYKDLSVKDYSPEDYLESERPLLSARDRIQVKVVIEDPGSEAMDYNVEVCLRKNSVIRCKEKTQ